MTRYGAANQCTFFLMLYSAFLARTYEIRNSPELNKRCEIVELSMFGEAGGSQKSFRIHRFFKLVFGFAIF